MEMNGGTTPIKIGYVLPRWDILTDILLAPGNAASSMMLASGNGAAIGHQLSVSTGLILSRLRAQCVITVL